MAQMVSGPWVGEARSRPARVEATTSQQVLLQLKSRDVIHGFMIPNLRYQIDVLPGTVTKFWFDANGQAAVLQDVKGSQIKATYNAIGQRASVNDPNQGVSNFTYNALGEVLTQTDARAITSTTTYINGGKRGFLVGITADDLVRVLKPTMVDAAA